MFPRLLWTRVRVQQVGLTASAILKLQWNTPRNVSQVPFRLIIMKSYGIHSRYSIRTDVLNNSCLKVSCLTKKSLWSQTDQIRTLATGTSLWIAKKGLHENPRNEKIRAKTVVLIDEDGSRLATIPLEQALQTASDKQLELVELKQQMGSRAAICQLYSRKAIYEAEKKYKHTTQGVKMKEVTITGYIATQDLQWKTKKIHDFLEHGVPVKLSITRKPYHKITEEQKLDIIRRVVGGVQEVGMLDGKPKSVGSLLTRCIFKPNKGKSKVNPSD